MVGYFDIRIFLRRFAKHSGVMNKFFLKEGSFTPLLFQKKKKEKLRKRLKKKCF